MRPLLLAAAFIATSYAASAQPLTPAHGGNIDLGTTRGSVFYTAEPDGYHVVATLQSGRLGDPIRFNTVLGDGQHASVSIPGPAGTQPEEVVFEHKADRLDVIYANDPATPTQ